VTKAEPAWYPLHKAESNQVQVAGASRLDVLRAGFVNHQVTSKGYVACRRLNNWQKLRLGGALYERDPCPCLFCSTGGIAF
jgi:hypothetical protein